MSSKTGNMIMVVAAVVFLALLSLLVKTGTTADSVAVLQASGMTCRSCADKVSRALESVKGVAATGVDVPGGWVVVGYDTKSVKPEALAEEVSRAGYGCNVYSVLTPEQFRQVSGRNLTGNPLTSAGCCGGRGSCLISKDNQGKSGGAK